MSLPALKGKYYPGSFTTIPYPASALIQLIGAGPFAVYAVLCERADGNTGMCTISNARLAAETGMSPSQMRVHKKVLVHFRLITVIRRHCGRNYDQVPLTKVVDMVRGPSGLGTQHWLYSFNPEWTHIYPDKPADARGGDEMRGDEGFDVRGQLVEGGTQRRWMRDILNQYSWGKQRRECIGPKEMIAVLKDAARSEPGERSVARQVGEAIRSKLRRARKRKQNTDQRNSQGAGPSA